jgi:hypothetical protein
LESIPEESPPRLRVLSRSVAREPTPKNDVPPAPVAEVVSTRTPAQSTLAILERRARYIDPNARAPSMPRGLSPAAVPYDHENPDHGWRIKNPLQSPGPPEPEATPQEKAMWAKGEFLLKSRQQQQEEAFKRLNQIQVPDPMDDGFGTTPEARTPTPIPVTIPEPDTKRRRLHEAPKPQPKQPKPRQRILGSIRRNVAPMRTSRANKRIHVAPHLIETQARTGSAAQNTRADHTPSPIPVMEEAKQAEPILHSE